MNLSLKNGSLVCTCLICDSDPKAYCHGCKTRECECVCDDVDIRRWNDPPTIYKDLTP